MDTPQDPSTSLSGDCNPVNPTDPSTGIGDDGGCEIGVPTLPNLGGSPNANNPCEILKTNDNNVEFKTKLDSLQNLVTKADPDLHETLITVTKESSGELKYNIFTSPTSGTGYIGVSGETTNKDIIDVHNHPPNTIPIFAFGDIVNVYDTDKYLLPSRQKIYISYLVNFNGTRYTIKINDTLGLDALFAGLNIGTQSTTKAQKDLAKDRILKLFESYGQDAEKTYTQADAEKLFMNVLNDPKIGAGTGIHLYRKDSDGWGKLNMDATGTITKDNCSL